MSITGYTGYSAWISLLKALFMALGTVFFGLIARGIATGDFSPTPAEDDAVMVALTSFCAGLYAGLKNVVKNAPWDRLLPKLFGGMFVLAITFSLTGCASTMPALAGKTDLTTEFRDVVVGENQDTFYKQTIKAPAGVQLDGLASMGYRWRADGTGDISVSNAQKADTTYQADALVQVNAQQMDLIKAMMDQIVSLAGIASPLIGGKISVDANQKQIDSANKAALRQSLVEMLGPAISEAIQSAAKANQVYAQPQSILPLPSNK